jgi:nitrogen fixation/metabolism regulation signal transduction histidine kinase
MMTMMQMESREDLDPDFVAYLQTEAEKADRIVLIGILLGVLSLVIALGLTGIVVTHRLVGPAYKIKRLLGEVRDGHIRVDGALRKHDELKDIFVAFEEMVQALRKAQTEEVEQLDAAIAHAKEAGVPEEAIREIVSVRDRMRQALN